MTKIKSFDKAIGHARSVGGNCHILLGNGFSIGAHEQFQYGTLYEQALEAGLPGHIVELFERYGTANFEEVLRQLEEGAWLADHYKMTSNIDDRDMLKDYERLKESLIEAIAGTHPPFPASIDEDRLRQCAEFLELFNDVYTINYDLLMYWASLVKEPFQFKDGFGREIDTDDSYCEFVPATTRGKFIYSLHGALHLTTVDGEVRKLVWSKTGIPLIEQARASLERKQYPLVVSEGTALEKKVRIEASSYLSWAFRKFENIQGSLFIYGWSLSDQDQHLLDAIAQNTSLPRLYVGIYGDPDTEANKRLLTTARSLKRKREEVLASGHSGGRTKKESLEVRFFDASTADVWAAL